MTLNQLKYGLWKEEYTSEVICPLKYNLKKIIIKRPRILQGENGLYKKQ